MEHIDLRHTFELAISEHRAGNLDAAETLYESILSHSPDHSDAKQNLGIIAVSKSQFDRALGLFSEVVYEKSDVEQYWVSYISTFIKLGDIEQAKKYYREILNKDFANKTLASLESAIRTETEKLDSGKVGLAEIQHLTDLYNRGDFLAVMRLGETLIKELTDAYEIFNLLGVAASQLKKTQGGIFFFS